MTVQERISQWVDAHEAELMRDIGRLVAVRSVRGEAEPDAPFGPGPRAALDEALALCAEYGFATEIYGCAVGTADLNDQPSRARHSRPPGRGWRGRRLGHRRPTRPSSKDDGCLYGRGTDDDKGPVVDGPLRHALPAGAGPGPSSTAAACIMGTDEESGSERPALLLLTSTTLRRTPSRRTPAFPSTTWKRARSAPTSPAAGLPGPPCPASRRIKGGFRINVIPADATAP